MDRLVLLVIACGVTLLAQAPESADAREGRRLYTDGCSVPEAAPILPVCKRAAAALERALRQFPSSPELNYLYGAAELIAGLPNSRTDGPRRLRAAVRAKPDLADAYYALLDLTELKSDERLRLMRQLLAALPADNDANVRYLAELQQAGRGMDEILAAHRQYRANVPLSQALADTEMDRDIAGSLITAGRVREAAAIYQSFLDFAERLGDPMWACGELRDEDPKQFAAVPDFQEQLVRVQRYCADTGRFAEGMKFQVEGKLAEAAEKFEQQIQTNPYYLHAYPTLAKLHLRVGRQSDAVRTLQLFFAGDWPQTAKCVQLADFEDLTRYRVPGDATVDRIGASCKTNQ